MKFRSLIPKLVLLVSGAIAVAGCVSRPKENASPGELLILGQEDLKSERFEGAREAFKRLLREFPDSKHRREALLNLGDSYYKAGEYIEAKVQYAEYVQLYPVSPQTPKAYYYLGMSDYNQRLLVDQDQTNARDALKNFSELLKRFPKSKFAADARKKTAELRKQLGEHEMFVVRFFIRRGENVSAIPRLRNVVDNYRDQADLRAEALFLLGETYLKEESLKKAGNAYRLLIRDYPKHSLAQTAYSRLLKLTGKQ